MLEKVACEWFTFKSKSKLKEAILKDIQRSLELHIIPSVGNQDD